MPHEDSDVDLLVVMPAYDQHSQSVRSRYRLAAPFPLDLIVRTPKEMAWRLEDGESFLAQLAASFQLSATAATAEEATRQLAELLQRRLQEGMELRTLTVPVPVGGETATGWLPDDELTRDWLQLVQQYRAECDAADRARLAPPGRAGDLGVMLPRVVPRAGESGLLRDESSSSRSGFPA